jgi:hypothetical protein
VSKRTSTRWYIGAWLVAGSSLIVSFMTANKGYTGTAFYAIGTSPVSSVALLLVGIASIVLFVTWIGALIRLGQLHSWGWLVVVFALGIVGMVAYALAGPQDDLVVQRPTVT